VQSGFRRRGFRANAERQLRNHIHGAAVFAETDDGHMGLLKVSAWTLHSMAQEIGGPKFDLPVGLDAARTVFRICEVLDFREQLAE